jgi:hypothetical protein
MRRIQYIILQMNFFGGFMNQGQFKRSNLTIMAHQGWQGQYPSNSYEAITFAFGKAEAVEFDVYRALDKNGNWKVICAHPESYFLYVDRSGMKNDGDFPMSYEDAIAFRARGAQLMPDIEQVLDAWMQSGATTELQVELKGPGIPEILIPLLLNRAAVQGLPLWKICITGLCYPGDRSRILETRALSNQIRIVLPMRGGNFAQDGFEGLSDVLEFAAQQQVEIITIHRKNLTRALVGDISKAGFTVGTYHGRTTDELEAAVALGVSYIAADQMLGTLLSDYSDYSGISELVYDKLLSIGFFTLRDWIWEVSWDLEKRLRSNVLEWTLEESKGGTDAVCGHDLVSGNIKLTLFHAQSGLQKRGVQEVGDEVIGRAFYGSFDGDLCNGELRIRDVVAADSVCLQYHRLLSIFGIADGGVLGRAISFERISVLASNRGEASPLEVELARAVLWRLGRILGMLTFVALNPRHGRKEHVSAVVYSNAEKLSPVVNSALREQFHAQLLRSGVAGVVLASY